MQLVQLVFGLAELAATCRFTAYDIGPSQLFLAPIDCQPMPLRYSFDDVSFEMNDKTCGDAIVKMRLETVFGDSATPSPPATTDLQTKAFDDTSAFKRIGERLAASVKSGLPTNGGGGATLNGVRMRWRNTDTVMRAAWQVAANVVARGRLEQLEEVNFLETWDFQQFFARCARTTELELHRSRMVATVIDCEHLEQVLRNDGAERFESIAVRGQAIVDLLPADLLSEDTVAWVTSASLPRAKALLSPAKFCRLLLAHDQLLLHAPSSMPHKLTSSVVPHDASWSAWPLPSLELAGLHQRPSISDAWYSFLTQRQPSSIIHDTLLRSISDVVVGGALPANVNAFLLGGGGLSGNKTLRVTVRGAGGSRRPCVGKLFDCAKDCTRLMLDATKAPLIQCGSVAAELICTLSTARLYEQGKCVNFVQVLDVLSLKKQAAPQAEQSGWFNWWPFGAGAARPPAPLATLEESIGAVLLVLEKLDGGAMSRLDDLIVRLQRHVLTHNRTAPAAKQLPLFTRDVYLKNAVAQVVGALRVFVAEYEGMHNDLHLNNIMIKECDNTTLFDGKPLAAHEYFSYKPSAIDEPELRVPNLGFVVKLIDFGLSQVTLRSQMASQQQHRTYALRNDSPLFNMGKEALKGLVDKLSVPLASDLATRMLAARNARRTAPSSASFDLQTFANHLSTSPLYYRLDVTVALEEAEFVEHFRTGATDIAAASKSEDTADLFTPLNVGLYYSVLGGVATARVPRSLEAAKLTPAKFARSPALALFHVGAWQCDGRNVQRYVDVLEHLQRLEMWLDRLSLSSESSVQLTRADYDAVKDHLKAAKLANDTNNISRFSLGAIIDELRKRLLQQSRDFEIQVSIEDNDDDGDDDATLIRGMFGAATTNESVSSPPSTSKLTPPSSSSTSRALVRIVDCPQQQSSDCGEHAARNAITAIGKTFDTLTERQWMSSDEIETLLDTHCGDQRHRVMLLESAQLLQVTSAEFLDADEFRPLFDALAQGYSVAFIVNTLRGERVNLHTAQGHWITLHVVPTPDAIGIRVMDSLRGSTAFAALRDDISEFRDTLEAFVLNYHEPDGNDQQPNKRHHTDGSGHSDNDNNITDSTRMATDATDQSIELPVNKKRKSGPNEEREYQHQNDDNDIDDVVFDLK